MLQINIKHKGDKVVYITSLYDDENLITEFDVETGMIELEPCRKFIGQEIIVEHTYEGDSEKTQRFKCLLEAVDFDKNTNIKSLRYQSLQELE